MQYHEDLIYVIDLASHKKKVLNVFFSHQMQFAVKKTSGNTFKSIALWHKRAIKTHSTIFHFEHIKK